jgi:hypothetical protein
LHLDLPLEAFPFGLDLGHCAGHLLFAELLGVPPAFVDDRPHLFVGGGELLLQVGPGGGGLVAGGLGFGQGRPDVLLAGLQPGQHRLPSEPGQDEQQDEEYHDRPDRQVEDGVHLAGERTVVAALGGGVGRVGPGRGGSRGRAGADRHGDEDQGDQEQPTATHIDLTARVE